MDKKLSVLKLGFANAWRTYLGGKLIQNLHGNENGIDNNFPEEWIMSVVQARNTGREHITEGLNEVLNLEQSITLKELSDKFPEMLYGASHVEKHGITSGVLAKILDCAERLTVQVHPTKQVAKKMFNSEFGKTECWYFLNGRKIEGEEPHIYLGFKPGVTKQHWVKLFKDQDVDGMLECMHKIYVDEGDVFIINGGVPHAIGCGCFLVEIQEPTDYTIRVERQSAKGLKIDDFMCHQGLGFEKMMDCFVFEGKTKQKIIEEYKVEPKINFINGITISELIGYDITNCFKLELYQLKKDKSIELTNNVFSGVYVLKGEGCLILDNETIAFKQADQFFLPVNLKSIKVKAIESCKVLRFYGPKI